MQKAGAHFPHLIHGLLDPDHLNEGLASVLLYVLLPQFKL